MISNKLRQFAIAIVVFCVITTATIFGYADSAQADPVSFLLSSGNHFTSLQADMKVPKRKVKRGTVAIWPGLQPASGAKPYGVLQPIVASVNPSVANRLCALKGFDGTLPKDYYGWYMKSLYDETESVCEGDAPIAVKGGDNLHTKLRLSDDVWTMTISDSAYKLKRSLYKKSLPNQDQIQALFAVEPRARAKWNKPVTFTNIVMTVAKKDRNFCVSDYPKKSCTKPTISNGGKTCEIASCTVSP